MAHLLSYVQSIANHQKHLVSEIENLKKTVVNQNVVGTEKPTISIDHELDVMKQKIIKEVMNDMTTLTRNEVQRCETSIQTRLEQFISKTVKDRLELAMQSVRSHLNEIDLRVDELKEDLVNLNASACTTNVATVPASTPIASSQLDIDTLPTSSIDIEALTKNILAGSVDDSTASQSGTKTEDINFSQTKKKILRKMLPSKQA